MRKLVAALLCAGITALAPPVFAQVTPGSGVGAQPPITAIHCAKWVNSFTIGDSGAACGSGTVNSGTAGDGAYYAGTGTAVSDAGSALTNFGSLLINGNAILTGPASAQFQQGAADVAGAPIAQTWSYQSASGASNQAGANTTIDLSAGTGTGVGGNFIINGAPHSTTGTTKNAYSEALFINGDTLNANFQGAVIAAGNVQPGASSFVIWTGHSKMQSPADAEFQIQNNAGSTTLMDIGVTTASTITLPLATTISNATVKMTALAASTAADVMCYATSTGLLTYEPTGTTCTVSARRFKRDIKYLSSATMLQEVLAMKPVSYRYKPGIDDGGAETHYGMIAEDMQKAAPELVAYEKDGQTHGIKYGDGEMQSHLIGAIKAEQDEINQLKKQIASLSSEFCLGSLCVGWR